LEGAPLELYVSSSQKGERGVQGSRDTLPEKGVHHLLFEGRNNQGYKTLWRKAEPIGGGLQVPDEEKENYLSPGKEEEKTEASSLSEREGKGRHSGGKEC